MQYNNVIFHTVTSSTSICEFKKFKMETTSVPNVSFVVDSNNELEGANLPSPAKDRWSKHPAQDRVNKIGGAFR